jgi:hypothetical protein
MQKWYATANEDLEQIRSVSRAQTLSALKSTRRKDVNRNGERMKEEPNAHKMNLFEIDAIPDMLVWRRKTEEKNEADRPLGAPGSTGARFFP